MRAIATVQQIRDAEQAWFDAHPGEDLMAEASAHVASTALQMVGDHARVLVVVGTGNNGGDGLFAARDLANAGCDVAVWCTGSRWHEAGRAAAEAAGCVFADAREAVEGLAEASLVIDAVLGIGGRAGLREPVAEFARACADVGVPVLSVDLPSGLAADSVGARDTISFRATRTVTFGALKLCQLANPARQACGLVELAPIGLQIPSPRMWATELVDIAAHWPFPGVDSDKYSRGVVGLDTGSERYPGAGVLSTTGALFSGAGMIRFCGARRSAELVGAAMPSVTFGPGRVEAWVLGCGWGARDDAASVIAERLATGVPAVLDADALRDLPDTVPGNCLLTPHAGELARLLGRDRAEVEADPVAAARTAAARYGATVLLKGSTQYVAEPSGRVTLAVEGPAWTAQAGSGDTLAGICGTLLAAGLSARWAGVLGASIQALTAAAKPGPYPPDALAHRMPGVLAKLAGRAAGARD
ncbi:NAD(P)H-hydrate epimerase [Propionibacterium freudenreichii]|uniref:Bifunctional NAD(P)H-hydrate repair enzyme n=4 Tax=Propionibacterium freudenreichii TaxID=1744 RepID=D7GJ88_PROFC|nr:NAD(P)H-hydrate epimerase [Propionibacterium freudenreichii]PWM98792.1 MAG: NAD(P)H-hydrate epimerase [Propionibacterium sp.]AJQ90317.1 YjeF protein [Propionibacterium freudenreichii subsp. freudenreichii]MCQ1996915.1 NAD(P)H-hydrate epimerase [Propionibacterium freudenreichii]MCT2973261.1 NAD(P)H-hydrate epimerase [Propionibacterium freudenreichii]MCT2975163.1 NAD(P)H-hydrate epimerase [Propionibacterium freudenreichii]